MGSSELEGRVLHGEARRWAGQEGASPRGRQAKGTVYLGRGASVLCAQTPTWLRAGHPSGDEQSARLRWRVPGPRGLPWSPVVSRGPLWISPIHPSF